MSELPIITAADLAAGHDGLAEVEICITHPNGAMRTLSLPYDAVAEALDASKITCLADLVGRPWMILAPPSLVGPGPQPSPNVRSENVRSELEGAS